MALFNKTSRIVLNILRKGMQQVRSIRRTCNKNVLYNPTLLDVNRKPSVTRFYRRVDTDTKYENTRPFEEFFKRSFRKLAMEHQTDTFKLNGFITPMAAIGAYGQDAPYPFVTNWRWYVTTKDEGGPVKQSGGGLGKLDAKGEAGFFHKVSLSRLEQIKKMLKENKMKQKSEAPKDDAEPKK